MIIGKTLRRKKRSSLNSPDATIEPKSLFEAAMIRISSGSVLVPPKKVCHRCFNDLTEWVEVSDEGTLETFTVVHYNEPELHPVKAPLAYGIVRLDGADTGMTCLIGEVGLDGLKKGMRLKAVFKEVAEGNYMDIEYFRPVEGASHG